MTPIHYSQVTVIPSQHLDPFGVLVDAVPVFNGTVFMNQYPVAAFNAGTSLGRVAEINVTGSGGLATVSGKRLNINIDKGVNARSVSPSVGVYQAVSNLDFGAGFLTSFSAGTVTVSTTAATPNIGMSNGGVGVGLIVSPGANNSFVLRSILAGSGINVTQFGDNVQISTVAGAGLQGTNGNGLSVTANTVALGLASISSPGAAPQLSGVQTDYWAGDGVFRALPTFSGVTSFNMATGAVQLVNGTNTTVVSLGGGQFRIDAAGGSGAVTSVTSGNPTALTVSPTTGAVVVTPNGQSTTLNSAWNPTTRILSIPVGVYQGGILTSSTLNQFDLSVAAASNTVEVRWNGVTVNPAASIINLIGAGVTNVSNGVGVEVTIAGGGGGGITGVSINGVGNYANIIVNGAGVSVVGNMITVSGVASGVNSVSVSAPITNTGTSSDPVIGLQATGIIAGTYGASNAIPVLTLDTWGRVIGITTQAPTGGGGAVTSVVTGMGSVLSVTPSVGNVVITPIGSTTTFTPSFNTGTYTLTVSNTAHQGGILSAQGNTNLDLSILRGFSLSVQSDPNNVGLSISGDNKFFTLRAGTNVLFNTTFPTANSADITINATGGLPSGASDQTMRHNGTTWVATSNLLITSSSVYSGKRLTVDPSNTATGITLDGNGSFNTISCPRPLLLDATSLRIGAAGVLTGFFGATAIAQPVIIAGNLPSIEAALIGLGLARY